MIGVIGFIKKHKLWIIFFLTLALHIFLRFYQLEIRSFFSWDQVDTAWKTKEIILDNKFPLLGPAARWGSGIFIGPAYVYIGALFYFLTNLDPIASGIFAGVVSIVSFFTIFWVTKKIFSNEVALIAVIMNTVSFSAIQFDRIQWEVNFVPIISLILFYALYKIIIDRKEKYVFLLSFILGSAFHGHLTTAVFLPIITIFSLPLFPWSRKLIKYCIFSLPLFLIWLVPIAIAVISTSLVQHSANYTSTSLHGFHFRRFTQLTGDAFIEFQTFFRVSGIGSYLKFLFLPAFYIIYYLKSGKKSIVFFYLIFLWYIVPWVVFALYSGEISNYYFSINRPISLIIISYLAVRSFQYKNYLMRSALIIFAVYYSFTNLYLFSERKYDSLYNYRAFVKTAIKNGVKIEYKEGDPKSYLYYIYTRKK